MFSIQLTEPALLLFAFGVLALFLARRELAGRRTLLTVAAVWFFVPLAASVFLRTPLYSGFRQLLFALPPLFLIAALGLEQIWRWVENRLMRAALALAVLAPGLARIAGLRPYEYNYFNSVVGGVAGAEGLYAHDYWRTSYREAMTYVDAIALPGARVAIAEPFEVASPFARSDLELVRLKKTIRPTTACAVTIRANSLRATWESSPAHSPSPDRASS
jgi:hypothetical protein